jgi:hypothetical protein
MPPNVDIGTEPTVSNIPGHTCGAVCFRVGGCQFNANVPRRLPRQFFRVHALDPAGWGEVGSKSYADESHARSHLDSLRRKGIRCDLYTTSTAWTLIDQQPELEGQEELF